MFYRKFSLLLQDVVVVGCGGTGSRVIAPLIQLMKTAPNAIDPRLFLVDGDLVEHKNLSRQNFIEPDVGHNKAKVLAERYGQAFDFPVTYVPEFLKDDNTPLSRMVSLCASEQHSDCVMRNTRKLFILCVDSIEARRIILNKVKPGDVIIDSGNEDSYGHVSIFDTVCLSSADPAPKDKVFPTIKPFMGEFELPFIPAITSVWENSVRNPPVATGSCADLDQSLAINFVISSAIINLVQNLMYNNNFYYRTLYYDLHRGNSGERMTAQWLANEFNNILTTKASIWSNTSYEYLYTKKLEDDVTSLYEYIYKLVGESVEFVPDNLINLLK